jgi:multidrug efflux pump subunit AcrB
VNFSAWLQNHRRSVLLLVGGLAAGGIVSLVSLPVGLFPRTSFPRVVISIDAGTRPADRMVVEVTRPIEEAVRGVPGVLNVRSNTSRGSADISIDFAWGLDMIAATLQVESALAKQLPDLPPGVRYGVRRMDTTVFPVIGLSLASKTRSLIELRDIARFDLEPLLSTIEGVAQIGVLGGRQAELQVRIDPARLAAAGLTLDDVVRRVSAANVVEAVGRLEEDEKLYLLLSNTQFTGLGELAQVIVGQSDEGFVRLEDVATLGQEPAPEWTRVVADGREAVLLNVYQQPGGHTVQIARDLASRLAEYRARAPSDLSIGTWYDQSELIRAAAGSVRDAVAIGIALSVLVLWGFLRNLRITLVVVLTVPVVLAATLLLLRALGLGLNIMTLGGLAAAVGLVVDDGIVMVEHMIRRLREEPAPSGTVVLRAAREMALPLSASSFATVIIFLPLAFLSGVTGAFFKALSATMASALILSYLVAYLAVPLLADALLRERDARAEDVGPRFGGFLDAYARILHLLVSKPKWLVVALIPFLGLGALAWRSVGSGFMPTMDEGGFILDYVAPPGTSLEETDRRLHEVGRILSSIPEVRTYSRRTGLALGGYLTEPNEGDYFVRLAPPPRRSIDEIMADVRRLTAQRVPTLDIELAQLMEDLIGDLTAVPQPIEVKLFGPDAGLLRGEADGVAAAVRAIPGVVDVKNGVVLAGDAVEIGVDRLEAQLLGLDPDSLTRLARVALEGDVTTEVQRGEKMVGVRVWTEADARSRLDRVRNLQVLTPDGRQVRLGRVARFERVVGQPQITRENMKTMVAVTGRIEGRDLGSVMRDVRRSLADVHLGAGEYVRYGGLYQEQQKSFRGLLGVLLAAVVLVFLLLLYLYEQFAAPLAILLVDGLAATAVFSGLWWTGSELNVSSMMGLTMIVGISSEAAVFYMTQWRECSETLPFVDALVAAGRLRLRPILMTALAAIGALLPLALGIGAGSAMLQPLAIAIIAGLVVTVPGVLLVLPVVFGVFVRRSGGGRGPINALRASSPAHPTAR